MTDKPGSFRMTVEAAKPGAKPVKRFVGSSIDTNYNPLKCPKNPKNQPKS